MTLREWLRAAQVACPHLERFDLEHLLARRLDRGRAHLLAHLDEALPEALQAQLEEDVARLSAHEPLQYVLGEAWFMDALYEVNAHVLIPRFDTEYLVQAVLERVDAENARVLDLCTGSGIIAITLARVHANWCVAASDISPDALAVAGRNAARLGATVEWREGDLFAPWQGAQFDCIASNPPYISAEEYQTLAPEVHREPALALLAEHDGLDFYERLAAEAPHYLAPGGWLAVEIGWQQGPAVVELFEKHGFKEVSCLPDGQGHDRVVCGHIE